MNVFWQVLLWWFAAAILVAFVFHLIKVVTRSHSDEEEVE